MIDGRSRLWPVAGAGLGFLAVLFGAFGAHALESRLDTAAIDTWRLAADYQFRHALALVAIGLAARLGAPPRACGLAGAAWLAGTVAFSGSLYGLAVTDVRAIAFLTPLGGTLLLVGWIAAAMAFAAWRDLRRGRPRDAAGTE